MRCLVPFFSINSNISLDFIIEFNIGPDTKKLFEAIVADGREKIKKRLELIRAVF